jgi:hypothetical protein
MNIKHKFGAVEFCDVSVKVHESLSLLSKFITTGAWVDGNSLMGLSFPKK